MDQEEYFADDVFEEHDEFLINGVDAAREESTNTNLLSDSLLYKGAPITLGASLLLIITFAITHNLTGEAVLNDLLSLIACHCRPIYVWSLFVNSKNISVI